jgi:hypothetical protein
MNVYGGNMTQEKYFVLNVEKLLRRYVKWG